MQLYVITRHGESTLNFENRVNGDPSVPVHLTEKGRDEARLLGQQLANVPIDLCVHTPFLRTRETAEVALAGRDVPFEEVPELGDIDIGELEGKTVGTTERGSVSTHATIRFQAASRSTLPRVATRTRTSACWSGRRRGS
jgi:broad specificity phosphatase PhoE